MKISETRLRRLIKESISNFDIINFAQAERIFEIIKQEFSSQLPYSPKNVEEQILSVTFDKKRENGFEFNPADVTMWSVAKLMPNEEFTEYAAPHMFLKAQEILKIRSPRLNYFLTETLHEEEILRLIDADGWEDNYVLGFPVRLIDEIKRNIFEFFNPHGQHNFFSIHKISQDNITQSAPAETIKYANVLILFLDIVENDSIKHCYEAIQEENELIKEVVRLASIYLIYKRWNSA